jgi:hypothetical protein
MIDVVCFNQIFFIKFKYFLSLVWNIWDQGRQPPKATLKHGSIYDYYDVLEEIGR